MAEKWVVTGQRQTMMQSSGGQWIESMRVDFKTISGVDGFVTVPLNQYGPDAVRKLIDAREASIDNIAQL